MKIIRTLLCLIVVGLAAPVEGAVADGYSFHVCQMPDGSWNGSTAGLDWSGSGIGASFDSRCATGGDGYKLHLSDQAHYGEEAQSRVDIRPPADTLIQSVAVYRETRGIRRCNPDVSPCSVSQNLLNYQMRVDGVLHDTCSPFAAGTDGTGQCNTGLSGSFASTGLSADHVSLALTCGFKSSGTCARDLADPPAVLLRWVRVGLQDTADPSVTSVTGALAGAGPHRGVESLSFTAADRGGGIYRGLVEVDGKRVHDQVIDPNVVGGRSRCEDVQPGDADPYQFVDPVPCKMSASATVSLDTRTVSDGPRDVRVLVEDASGNETTVLAQRLTVDNVTSTDDPACRNGIDDDGDGVVDGADGGCTGGEDADERPAPGSPAPTAPDPTSPAPSSPNPIAPGAAPGQGGTTPLSGAAAPASSPLAGDAAGTRGAPNGDMPADDARLSAAFAQSGRGVLTTRFGTRAVVRGRLVTGQGRPIANARVEMLSQNANPGATRVDKGGARTRADGTWTMILPRDASSRTLTFRYRSHLRDTRPVAEATLRLRVRAGVALRVTPRAASRRGAIRISGRLLGGPRPARGKLIELQARGKGGGRWITFRTVRSDARGAFSTRYAFRNTVGPVTYVFRARAREEAAYPYLTGASRVVSVRVR